MEGIQGGESGNACGISPFLVPEVMDVAIGENDEPDFLRIGVFSRLLFPDERVFILWFRLQDTNGKSIVVGKKVITYPFFTFS